MSFDSIGEPESATKLLADLYAKDAPQSVLLAEYPSSNSDQTRFRNTNRYIIHDPYPPPRPELLKCLGPHHLMFGWGDQLPVTSQVELPNKLVEHWCELLGDSARPQWVAFDELSEQQKFVVLFPHESISPDRQLVDPDVNYFLHSKQVISKIDCSQADVFESAQYPCIAKLSHGYAGLGNYVLRNEDDERTMNELLSKRWPRAELVYNSIVEDIEGDYGIQFYLTREGEIVWLGFTEQNFDEQGKWSGGKFSYSRQLEMFDEVESIVSSTADYLHQQGYFGVVGIDILKDSSGRHFLVDVNPRLTGITPFLIASRIFSSDPGLVEGEYRASCRVAGGLDQLLQSIGKIKDAKVAVLSAFEDESESETICHLSVTSDSQARCSAVFKDVLGSPAG